MLCTRLSDARTFAQVLLALRESSADENGLSHVNMHSLMVEERALVLSEEMERISGAVILTPADLLVRHVPSHPIPVNFI
jgi:hypothetical protein